MKKKEKKIRVISKLIGQYSFRQNRGTYETGWHAYDANSHKGYFSFDFETTKHAEKIN